MGKKYISSPLCATYSTFHRISTFSSSSFFFAYYPSPPPFFDLHAAARRMNPECSYGIFTKSSDFSRSRGEWRSVAVAVAVECGDISKAAFSCCYLAKNPPPLPPSFPYSPPAFSYPSVPQSSLVLRWDAREGRNN